MRVFERQLRAAALQQGFGNKDAESEPAGGFGGIVRPRPGREIGLAEPGEVTTFGKPLYKIADLSTMTLRAYVAGDQLGAVKVGQQVKIFVDAEGGAQKEFSGKIMWISPKAEFTPKVVQTKDERVNLVYAMKISVPNSDGVLKIGMPAEVILPKM